jgi:ribosomal protein L32
VKCGIGENWKKRKKRAKKKNKLISFGECKERGFKALEG